MLRATGILRTEMTPKRWLRRLSLWDKWIWNRQIGILQGRIEHRKVCVISTTAIAFGGLTYLIHD